MVRFFFCEVDNLDSIALRRGSTTPNQNSCVEGPGRSYVQEKGTKPMSRVGLQPLGAFSYSRNPIIIHIMI